MGASRASVKAILRAVLKAILVLILRKIFDECWEVGEEEEGGEEEEEEDRGGKGGGAVVGDMMRGRRAVEPFCRMSNGWRHPANSLNVSSPLRILERDALERDALERDRSFRIYR